MSDAHQSYRCPPPLQGEVLVVDRLNNIYHMPCGDLCAEATSSPGATSSGIGAAYSYVGCFADDSSNRVLTGSAVFGHPSMTAEVGALLVLHGKGQDDVGKLFAGLYENYSPDTGTEAPS